MKQKKHKKRKFKRTAFIQAFNQACGADGSFNLITRENLNK